MIKGQNGGSKWEEYIIEQIHGKNFNELDGKFQNLLMIIGISNQNNGIIQAVKPKGAREKTDIIISDNTENSINISVKSGSGNHIHQEKIYEFCDFIRSNGFSEKEINEFLYFHWCDGTIDNSGIERINLKKFKKIHSNRYQKMINLFQKIKYECIKRVLIGNNEIYTPDWMFYGNNKDGDIYQWKYDSVLEYHQSTYNSEKPVGNLGIQAWNACLNKNPKSENKRYTIQFKWSNIFKDMERYIEQSRNA